MARSHAFIILRATWRDCMRRWVIYGSLRDTWSWSSSRSGFAVRPYFASPIGSMLKSRTLGAELLSQSYPAVQLRQLQFLSASAHRSACEFRETHSSVCEIALGCIVASLGAQVVHPISPAVPLIQESLDCPARWKPGGRCFREVQNKQE